MEQTKNQLGERWRVISNKSNRGPAAMTPERKVKHAVRLMLKAARFWAFAPVAGRNVYGIPDIIACSPKGLFLAIECKGASGKLTPLQAVALQEIERHGGRTFVAYPNNLNELELELIALS